MNGVDPSGKNFSLGGALVGAAIAAGMMLLFNPNVANAPGMGDGAAPDASGDIIIAGVVDAAGGPILKFGGRLVRFVGGKAIGVVASASGPMIKRMANALRKAHPRIGYVIYGGLDDLGRARGIQARITKKMIMAGEEAASHIQPPGYAGAAAGHAKGHLLARMLGGAGDLPENFVTLMHDACNNSTMKALETSVRSAVEAGEVVELVVEPIYKGFTKIPHKLKFTAVGNRGTEIVEEIVNPI